MKKRRRLFDRCIPRQFLGDPEVALNPLALPVIELSPPNFIKRSSLPSGKEGTKQTLKKMNEMWVNDAPQLRWVTGEIITKSGCKVKDYLCEVQIVYEWVRDNIHWIRDVREHETLQKPLRTLEAGFGDCDCLTTLLNSMLNSIGYDTMAVAGDLRADTREYSHVWSRVKVPIITENGPQEQWVPVDASDPGTKFGWESPKGTKRLTIDDDGHLEEEFF